MDWLLDIKVWLTLNKEWVFSGGGVVILTGMASWLFGKKSEGNNINVGKRNNIDHSIIGNNNRIYNSPIEKKNT